MVRLSVASALTFALSVYALGDPAGAKNVGNGAGGQFIGGQCLSSKDCASTCCAFIAGGGVCSGIGAQFQAGKSGCGFGDGGAPPQPSASSGSGNSGSGSTSNAGTSANVPAGFNTAVGDPAGVKNLGNGKAQQFITGICLSDADCASGCCAGLKGGAVCSGVGAQTQNGKTGCGFNANGGSSSAPASNSNSGSSSGSNSGSNSGSSSGSASNGVAIPAGFNTAVGDPAGVKNLGNGKAQQFITGICLSDADCASGCCAGLKGGAVCSGVGAQTQNGKTGCGFNANAKRSFEFSRIARRFNA
ncbi:biotrophy-associated secreted protein 2 [Trichoderma asperellum]|uniref:Biotrophy-associated secreted protein 2 n=1 Tax=Trichoderma asperellum TaxID=101201 RepID=A0A6V8QI34_TRIAP|nr:biotrophy-associated secreted protein 2 [Trichoderma asperellum]